MLSCLSILILGLLLAFPALAVEGASAGLLLWFNVVLPTLAPFMICTRMVSVLGAERLLIRPFYPLIHGILGFSEPGSYVLLCGLLCGYPLGARLCAEKLKSKEISLAEARCLLATANHPSPMFLLGFVNRQVVRVFEPPGLSSSLSASSSLPFSYFPWLIPLCLYLPVIPLSFLARHFYRFENQDPQNSQDSQNFQDLQNPQEHQEHREHQEDQVQVHPQVHQKTSPSSEHRDGNPSSNPSGISVEDAIFSTAHTMVLIGGWIMLFSILAKWVQTIPYFFPPIKAILGGIAEITTGIPLLCSAFSKTPTLCLILVTLCVAFGGGSGIFQTRSVLLANATERTMQDKQKNAGLSIRHYILWKALHALLATGTLIFLLWILPELERVLPAVPALLQQAHWILLQRAHCGLL